MGAAMPPVALTYHPSVQYTVSVRALCDFTARRGDLDLRFTPTPTAQEGTKGGKPA